MKIIKRSCMFLTSLFAAMLLLGGFVYASQKDTAGTYKAVSCSQDGEKYSCDDEYILLNEDGSGEVRFNDSTYPFKWTLDGDKFSFTDEDDYTIEGTLEDPLLKATVYDYDYVYEKVESEAADGIVNGILNGGGDDEEDSSDHSEKTPEENPDETPSVTSEDYSSQGPAEGPEVYYISSGDPSAEYIALNEDGTGMFLYSQAALAMTWKQDGSDFSFTDHLNNKFSGTKNSGQISGQYLGHDCTFDLISETLPVYNIDPDKWGKGLDYVTDQAGLLDDSQLEEVSKKAEEFTKEYDVGVYVVLLDRYKDFTWSGNRETLSEEIRAGYNLGVGYTDKKSKHESADVNKQWKDSILLMVGRSEREYNVVVSGQYADWAFSEYARNHIGGNVEDDLHNNQWYKSLSDYMDAVGKVLKVSAKGREFSFRDTGMGTLVGIIVPIILALLFGYGIAAIMKSSMQNTQKAQNAAAYVAGDQVNFTRREDYYIRTLVSRVYSPREKSKGSGGGGGHSFSGSSHTGGHF